MVDAAEGEAGDRTTPEVAPCARVHEEDSWV
jgi:hypothetical protein